MILYSIIPVEIVFENLQNTSDMTQVELEYRGEKILARPAGDNRYVIDRIVSTSLKAFLDPELQPGSIIDAPGTKLKRL